MTVEFTGFRRITSSFSPPLTTPLHVNDYSTTSVPRKFWEADVEFMEYVAKYKAAAEVTKNAGTKWEGIKSQIEQFMRQHTTLNQAVAAWPGFLLFVPEEYKDILAKKTERTKREKDEEDVEDNIDYESLTAAGTAHKMLGG